MYHVASGLTFIFYTYQSYFNKQYIQLLKLQSVDGNHPRVGAIGVNVLHIACCVIR